jgi:PhzF family phenazine biosynthesis protein
MQSIKIFQIDAFADHVFTGNPAAVCPLDHFLNDETMQRIAAENNLSETAFFTSRKGQYQLRWFTPTSEVDLCGHATLAAAHVIFNSSEVVGQQIIFETRSGELSVKRIDSDLYEMNFPADQIHEVEAPYNFIKALGIQPENAFMGKTDLLIVYKSESEILKLNPNYALLKSLPVRGIIATAPGKNVDFVSRFFAPSVGVNEDPATGSAHTTLTVYWNQRTNKVQFNAVQLSERTGVIGCALDGNRVILTGKAITFMEGNIFLPKAEK